MRQFALILLLLVAPAGTPLAQSPAPAASAVRSPIEFFGFRMGEDRQLAGWPEIQRYFQTVATESDRVELVEMGPSTDGNRLIAAIISSPANIARLEEIRAANLRLADPRTLSATDARGIAARNPVVVAIGASIHASEIGATQAANELLHTLATTEDPELNAVLDKVVLILIPSLNPDGHMLTVDWYRKWKGTEFEGSPMPWLYHRYVGHDINRDGFMMNMAENRTIADFFYRRWHPQVFLAMHQMGSRGPRFFVPPNYDPIDPNYDPIIWRTAGLLGHAMALALEEDGRTGVVSNALYDYYWPGYEDSVPLGHNTVCVLTEVASVKIATPIRVMPSELEGSPRGLPEYRPQINFPHPWPGGDWRLRDIVEYELSAVRGLLLASARYREELLRNFYRMAATAVENGTRGQPSAFVMPIEQFDPHAADKLRQLLLDGAIEIHRATAAFQVGDVTYPAGTDVIPMAQPFRAYVKTLLEKQTYPTQKPRPGAPPERPYDVAGWTLPWQMGVRVDRIDEPFTMPPARVLERSSIVPAPVTGEKSPNYYIVDGRGNGASIAVNRLHAAHVEMSWTTAPIERGGVTYGAGAIVVPESRTSRTLVQQIAQTLGLRTTAVRGRPPTSAVRLERVRVGLYKPWVENIDEGWTRWILEQYEFPYDTLTDLDIRRGSLRERHDVVIIPDQTAQRLLNGHAPGTMPPDYTGGLGTEGAAALKRFVDEGGTLITLDSSSELAIDLLALPVRDTLKGVRPEQFFCPGSLLRLTLDERDPLSFGLPASTAAFFAFGSAFEVYSSPTESNGDSAAVAPSARILGRYARQNVLMSGWLEGESMIAGQGAVVEAHAGHGRVVMFGFRPQHRAQAHATFRLLFNAIHTAHAAKRNK